MEQSSVNYTAYDGHPATATEADDMALLRRYVDLGSEAAFSELVRRHLAWVHATCRKALRDPHTAEDAAQAVFIILARRAATITPQTRLSGWLFNTARFVVKDARKQETRYRRREDVARELAIERQTIGPVRPAVDAHTQTALDDALATLTERDRLALIMHFYEGLSLTEMAESLGIGKEGVKKRVSRALARLRTKMGKSAAAGKSAGRSKRLAAPLAAVALLLKSRAASAAPSGLGRAAVSAAPMPGRGSAIARGLAEHAMTAVAGASHRLIQAMLVGSLAGGVGAVALMPRPPAAAPPATHAPAPIAAAFPGSFAPAAVAAVPPRAIAPSRGKSAQAPTAPAAGATAYASDPEPPYHSGADDPEAAPEEAEKPKPRATAPASSGAAKAAAAAPAALTSADAGNSTFAGLPPVQRPPAPQLTLPPAVDRPAPFAARADGIAAPSRNAPKVAAAANANPTTPGHQPTRNPNDPNCPPGANLPPGLGAGGTASADAAHDGRHDYADDRPGRVHVTRIDDDDDDTGGHGGWHDIIVADARGEHHHGGVRRDFHGDPDRPHTGRRHVTRVIDDDDEDEDDVDDRGHGGNAVDCHDHYAYLAGGLPDGVATAGVDLVGNAGITALTLTNGLDATAQPLSSADFTTAAAVTFQAVPEPGAISAVLLAGALLTTRRRRHRHRPA
jgi:RNA polymerase sigma factor (sigma-70 family)